MPGFPLFFWLEIWVAERRDDMTADFAASTASKKVEAGVTLSLGTATLVLDLKVDALKSAFCRSAICR